MNQREFIGKAVQLALTAAEFAREVEGMEEAAPDTISKYSWFLANSRDTGGHVKVIRHVTIGWGGVQLDSLLDGARSFAEDSKDALTAVVQSYGQESNPVVKVECYFKSSKMALEFPYKRHAGAMEFQPNLDEQREGVTAAMAAWANQAVPKKRFGIF